MRIKITKAMLSAIVVLAMTPLSMISQNNLTPTAPENFSIFSMPQNMGATLNSSVLDSQPLISPSGLSFYFGSARTGGLGGTDIWVSQRATLTSAWGAPQNVGILNTNANDFATSFSLDGRQMFISSTRTDGSGPRDIWLSTRTDPNNDFGWTTPINLGAPVNTACSDFAATYFEDTTTGINSLIFARECDPNNPPFHDLYQSTRNADGTFNTPVPITELNSIGTETRTAIRRDGLEIFITSSRPGVIGPVGSVDIFVSTRASTALPWNPPVLVAGINTENNEQSLSLSPDGSTLYFTSNRPGGSGNEDLYSVARVSVNRTPTADFDGDGRSDISVFRPSDGTWHILQSGTNTYRAQPFGLKGDKITPGDYDGDGRTDLAVFRPSTGTWWIMRSSNSSFSTTQWGLAADKPVPADYDGDGKTDIAVYRDGMWIILQSSNGADKYHLFGLSGDIPVIGGNAP